jgi:WS/DGAT/MGAT family acyltransferase
VARALRAPVTVAEGLWRLARDEGHVRHDLSERLRAFGRAAARTGAGATPAPWNRPIGPHRRVDWFPMSLDRIRAVRRGAGGTVNDVVLATAAGGVGRFLDRYRGVDPETLDFKVMAPVSVRAPSEQGAMGNRVSAWIVSLPVAEKDPLARLEQVRATTEELKESRQALGAELLTEATEWTGTLLLSLGSRLMTWGTPFNMVVTNVPGPRAPLWLLESRMLAAHPLVPLMGLLGLGIALFSYAGTLSWGFSADWDLVPDLHELVLATEHAFEELYDAATSVAS